MKRTLMILVLLLLVFPFACDDSSDSSDVFFITAIEIEGSWFRDTGTVYDKYSIYDDKVESTMVIYASGGTQLVWWNLYSYSNTDNRAIIEQIHCETNLAPPSYTYQKWGWDELDATGDELTIRFFDGSDDLAEAEAETDYTEVTYERIDF